MSPKLALLFIGLVALVAAAPESRIVNGDDAADGQFPYQVELYFAGNPLCGATILNENYLLTASRCVCAYGSHRPWAPQIFTIRAGSTQLYSGGVEITVAEIILNDDYTELNTGLAILKLRQPLVFSSTIKPISMAKKNPPTGAVVDITGFGLYKETDQTANRKLQYYDDVMLAQNECYGKIGKDDKTVMCLGHPRKFGICTGDFGSPAAYNGELVGVAGYILTEQCGTADPDVYISVPNFRQWILDVISK